MWLNKFIYMYLNIISKFTLKCYELFGLQKAFLASFEQMGHLTAVDPGW